MALFLYCAFITVILLGCAYFLGQRSRDFDHQHKVERLTAFEKRFENLLEEIQTLIDGKLERVEERLKYLGDLLDLADRKILHLTDLASEIDLIRTEVHREREKLRVTLHQNPGGSNPGDKKETPSIPARVREQEHRHFGIQPHGGEPEVGEVVRSLFQSGWSLEEISVESHLTIDEVAGYLDNTREVEE